MQVRERVKVPRRKATAAGSRGRTKPESSATRSGIQVIARAATILRALEEEPDGLSLGEIAAKVDLARSTVQRIVGALASEQLLIAASPKARVRLGPLLIRLADSANFDVRDDVRPYLLELSRELQETVDLSVLRGNKVVFVDQIVGSHRLRAVSAIGESFPLHCTANGKALLSILPPDRLDKLLRPGLERMTANTVTDPEALARDLARIRASHVALDREEHTEGICALGTALTDPTGRAFAISVPVPTLRFEKSSRQMREALLRCRDRLQKHFGVVDAPARSA